MATVNHSRKPAPLVTHEGGKAKRIDIKAQFRRTLCSCLLWEDEFYEDGVSVAERLKSLAIALANEDPAYLRDLLLDARLNIGLRHAPLWCLVALASVGRCPWSLVSDLLSRPDDATELIALYWKDRKKDEKKLPNSFKKGIARWFPTLDEYRLAKYGSRKGDVRLRDVMFLCHPKPQNEGQAELWRKLANDTLPEPGTWENELSAGKDKKEVWERLLREGKLGTLALIRNLRNMTEAKVDETLIKNALLSAKPDRIFPYQILQAGKYAPRYEQQIEALLFKCLQGFPRLQGKTVFLVDKSSSMRALLSGKSDMSRYDAAVALAVLLREVCDDAVIYRFDGQAQRLQAPRRGFALKDALGPCDGGSTRVGHAIMAAIQEGYDRLVVLTDEQSEDSIPTLPKDGRCYMINVASAQNGVGYGKPWVHIDGFSTNVLQFMHEIEAADLDK